MSSGQADAVDLTVYAKTADVEATYAKKSDIPTVPSKVSKLTNDAGYLTADDIVGKQDVISDIATIRSGAAAGATALQSHQDISGKADKAEMTITPGTGENADKTTIQLKEGTSATVLTAHQDLSAYATIAQLQEQIQALQEALTSLQNSMPRKLSDLEYTAPKANITVKVNYKTKDSYTTVGNSDEAWIKVNGTAIKGSGATLTKVYENMSIGESLTFSCGYLTKNNKAFDGIYEIIINGKPWTYHPLTGLYSTGSDRISINGKSVYWDNVVKCPLENATYAFEDKKKGSNIFSLQGAGEYIIPLDEVFKSDDTTIEINVYYRYYDNY